MKNQKLSDTSSSYELLSWRKQSFTSTEHCYSKNQNAIGHQGSPSEKLPLSDQPVNQQISNMSSASVNFSSENLEEININADDESANNSEKPINATRQTVTSEIRQRQQNRYMNYNSRMEESQLYSLNVSSGGLQCYGTNCQPSLFNISHRCQPIAFQKEIDTMEDPSMMNDQTIKHNMSFMSFTSLSNMLDQEPNVSRRDSYMRSTSNTLVHKPSLFLSDIFNKMTDEQRAKSIAQLTKLHQNLSKSNTTVDKLQHGASLPDLNRKLTRLHSVTSLSSERAIPYISQAENEPSSLSATDQKNSGIPNDKPTTNWHETTASSSIEEPFHTPVQSSQTSNEQSPVPSLGMAPKYRVSDDKIHASNGLTANSATSSPNLIASKKSDADTSTAELIRDGRKDLSNADSREQQLKVSFSSNKTADQQYPSKVTLASVSIQEQGTPSSNVQNENKGSLSDRQSQQDNGSDDTKPPLPFLETIDETSQPSESSYSHLKTPTFLNKSSVISSKQDTVSLISLKPTSAPLLSTKDDDNSVTTRTTTASTHLTTTDDDDEQSKLINEQLKRSSLGLARDSLELLRNTTPHHSNGSTEQLTPRSNMSSTPRKRRSVLKSHADSSDAVSQPDFISYVAIDEVKDNRSSIEKRIRRHSITVGGGTVLSCESPKPRRDSLTLLQNRLSESMTPHSGYYPLSGSDSRHVEFLRKPGDTITPALHIGRGTKLKQSSSKTTSPSLSNDNFSNHTINLSDRSKSETSMIGSQQPSQTEACPRCPSLNSTSRRRTPSTPNIPTTSSSSSSNNFNNTQEQKVCFNKCDYDAMVRLLTTPTSRKKNTDPVKLTKESNTELRVNYRFTKVHSLILSIILFVFYVIIFIKSQYWQVQE